MRVIGQRRNMSDDIRAPSGFVPHAAKFCALIPECSRGMCTYPLMLTQCSCEIVEEEERRHSDSVCVNKKKLPMHDSAKWCGCGTWGPLMVVNGGRWGGGADDFTTPMRC